MTAIKVHYNCHNDILHGYAKFILDHKKLYHMICEKANYDQTTVIDPHLWIYQPIITIDHVAKSLQQLKDSVKTDLTILQEFLENVRQYICVFKNCYSITFSQ